MMKSFNSSAIAYDSPMLSIKGTRSMSDVAAFVNGVQERFGDVGYILEPKVDGLSLRLVYQDGTLISASTRGDGHIGTDVLDVARSIPGIPKTVPCAPLTLEVRGEVYGSGMNRNQAAGILKSGDSSRAGCLRMFCFWIVDSGLRTQWNVLDALGKLGFPVNPMRKECKGVDEIADVFRSWNVARSEWPYQVDGAVLKVNRVDLLARIPSTARYDGGMLAWKFA